MIRQSPVPPPQIAHVLDANLPPDAFQVFGLDGSLLESGIANKSRQKHALGSVARVVVGQAVHDAIEGRIAEYKATAARHEQFDRDALAYAAAKRSWKCRCRVIRREMRLEIGALIGMARYVGQSGKVV
jgi:hypothetical protein